MASKRVPLYIDEEKMEYIDKYINDNKLKRSEFYREIFLLGFEKKTKRGNHFLSNEYLLEILFRTLLSVEQGSKIDSDLKSKIRQAAENKVTDLLTK